MGLSDISVLPLRKLAVAVLGTIFLALSLRVLFKIVYLLQERFRLDKIYKHIKGPPGHWFWGSIHEIKSPNDFIRISVEWTAKYGSVRKSRNGPFRVDVFLCDPESIQCVMKTAEPKEPWMYRYLEPWIGDGLLLSKGQKWARSRRLLTPAFHFEILKPYISIFENSTQIMIDNWKRMLDEGQDSIDMFETISLMTLHSLLKCTFGFESGCQTESKKSPYIKAVYDMSELIVKRFLNPLYQLDWLYYLTPNGFKLRKACNLMHQYSKSIIQTRRKNLQQSDSILKDKKYLDFLDILLMAKDEDGQGMTDEEIQDEVDTFMFEGHDTTASGLSFFLYNMARHTDHQQKCREEIQRVLEGSQNISWDQLHEMEYLTMCIKESLRLHPPVVNIGRKITKPITLPNGVTLQPGQWITLGIYGLHHNPKVWPDPEDYDPSRFTPGNCKDRSSYAFVPFSAGPRNCIGQHFAMNEMKTVAAMILRHFKLSPDESIPVILWPELILRSKDGVWLKVEKIA